MPILELQKRARELGRIRIGQQVAGTTKEGKAYTRPTKLDTFRLTSASKPLLEKVAELYGGDLAEWTPKGGSPQWEVVTKSARIPILVPPQPVSQWLETWRASGCVHRCDGVTNVLTDELCDPTDRDHIDARPTTRLNVVLRDVEGVGVWRLESHGWNAAIELPDAAQFLSQVGGYIDGHLALEQRTSIGENAKTGKPETRHFMVPIIEINVTPAELMAGKGAFAPPSVEGPVARDAIEAPKADYIALAEQATDADAVRHVWKVAREAGHMTDELNERLMQMAKDLEPVEGDLEDPESDGPSVDELWQQILTEGGKRDMNLWTLEEDFAKFTGDGATVQSATASQFAAYLNVLRDGVTV